MACKISEEKSTNANSIVENVLWMLSFTFNAVRQFQSCNTENSRPASNKRHIQQFLCALVESKCESVEFVTNFPV